MMSAMGSSSGRPKRRLRRRPGPGPDEPSEPDPEAAMRREMEQLLDRDMVAQEKAKKKRQKDAP